MNLIKPNDMSFYVAPATYMGICNSAISAYMPTVQIKEEHSSFWEKIIIILMQVFLFLYKFVCSIE